MATQIFGKLVGLFLGAVALFVIILYLFGGSGAFNKLAKAALYIGDWAMPDKTNPNVQPDESLPPQTTAAQDKFMNEIERFSDKENCIMRFSSLDGLGDQILELSNYDNGIQSRIGKKSGDDSTGRVYLDFKNTNQKNIKLCIIDPEPFYNCYLSGKKECSKITYKDVNQVTLTDKGIIFAIDCTFMTGGGCYDCGATADNCYPTYDNFIFKPTADRVCFIPFERNIGWRGCDFSEKALDNDCIPKLKNRNNIEPCQ